MKILVILIVVPLAGWLALQVYRIVQTVTRARRNIESMKNSGKHQAEIRLFVEAQSKLMKMDILMGVIFGIGLLALLGSAALLLLQGRFGR